VDVLQRTIKKYIASARWESAMRVLTPLLKWKLGGIKTIYLHVKVLRGTLQIEEAHSLILKALKNYPEQLVLYLELAKIQLDCKQPEKALESFLACEPIIREEEDWIAFSISLFQNGRSEDAWNALKPLVNSSRNGLVYALAGDFHFEWGQHKHAVSYYLKALHCGWDRHHLLSRIGFSLLHSGQTSQFSQAEHYFRRLLKCDSRDIQSTIGLGLCYEMQGRYHDALCIYQNGSAWDWGNLSILRQAGICAALTGELHFAEIYLQEVIQRGGGTPQTYAYFGYSLQQQERWKEAEEVYTALTYAFPGHSSGYRALAWMYGVGQSTQLDSREGLKMARRALELAPSDSAWELLSACEARAGNFQEAHYIHEQLSSHPQDSLTQKRRRSAMRKLRQGQPLDETLLVHALVA
jgi:tetratricopeptide (TPR) repeat protein